jgi:hypothetical protein
MPNESDCPLPLNFLDVMRNTKTDIIDDAEHNINDMWNIAGPRQLTTAWTGTTTFHILHTKPSKGKTWVMDRETKKQKSTRPPTIYPEVWKTLSKKDKQRAIDEWDEEQPLREAARLANNSLDHIDITTEDHAEILAEAQLRYTKSTATAAAMPMFCAISQHEADMHEQRFRTMHALSRLQHDPTISKDLNLCSNTTPDNTIYQCAACTTSNIFNDHCCAQFQPQPQPQLHDTTNPVTTTLQNKQRHHQPHFQPTGTFDLDGFSLVHTQIPMPIAMKTPKAKQAVDDEWDKLSQPIPACPRTGKAAKCAAWDLSSVRPKAEVQAEAKRNRTTAHFGSLMDLCHEKHSELNHPPDQRVYKGRVVFRGDQVRDENSSYAVFSEQSASASHMAAAKFLDAIARFPGNDGEDSDALAAYTQDELAAVPALLGGTTTCPPTWITLPKHRRPASWDSIQDPVCLLTRNLYGHKLAGLIWEKHCHKHVLAAGFTKIQGWECLFVHKTMQVFLSIYVDDFRMAGKASNL